jgi:hypothetical protein
MWGHYKLRYTTSQTIIIFSNGGDLGGDTTLPTQISTIIITILNGAI